MAPLSHTSIPGSLSGNLGRHCLKYWTIFLGSLSCHSALGSYPVNALCNSLSRICDRILIALPETINTNRSKQRHDERNCKEIRKEKRSNRYLQIFIGDQWSEWCIKHSHLLPSLSFHISLHHLPLLLITTVIIPVTDEGRRLALPTVITLPGEMSGIYTSSECVKCD